MNDNLRQALTTARLQVVDVAAALAVDPKTVNRWLKGRVPYPRHRRVVADLLGADEADIWPEVAQHHRTISSEVRAVYPHRWAVPQTVWRKLFESATEEIGILTYSGLFLAEDAGLIQTLADRARRGVRVRILLGDPASASVAARGAEEAIGPDVMAARVKNALTLFSPLQSVDGAEIRLHHTVLYNSIYRADDELLVNTHAYGTPAPRAPVINLRAVDDQGAAAIYLTSFDQVWNTAEPYRGRS